MDTTSLRDLIKLYGIQRYRPADRVTNRKREKLYRRYVKNKVMAGIWYGHHSPYYPAGPTAADRLAQQDEDDAMSGGDNDPEVPEDENYDDIEWWWILAQDDPAIRDDWTFEKGFGKEFRSLPLWSNLNFDQEDLGPEETAPGVPAPEWLAEHNDGSLVSSSLTQLDQGPTRKRKLSECASNELHPEDTVTDITSPDQPTELDDGPSRKRHCRESISEDQESLLEEDENTLHPSDLFEAAIQAQFPPWTEENRRQTEHTVDGICKLIWDDGLPFLLDTPRRSSRQRRPVERWEPATLSRRSAIQKRTTIIRWNPASRRFHSIYRKKRTTQRHAGVSTGPQIRSRTMVKLNRHSERFESRTSLILLPSRSTLNKQRSRRRICLSKGGSRFTSTTFTTSTTFAS